MIENPRVGGSIPPLATSLLDGSRSGAVFVSAFTASLLDPTILLACIRQAATLLSKFARFTFGAPAFLAFQRS